MNINKFYFPLLCLCLLFTFNACVNQQFDEPPAQIASSLVANQTIADLKAIHVSGAFEAIEEDIIIEGIVISSDEGGNFYKELIIQDATGGIGLSIDATNLYGDYPIGRKVYVKCNGLTLGDDNGSIQLGAGTTTNNNGDPILARIDESLVTQFIEKGERDQTVTVQTINISDVNESMINTMVRFEDVEFIDADAGLTYANPGGGFGENRMIQDCDENQIIVRTSDFADFAGDSSPVGNGDLTAVLSVYRADYQLFINNTGDVNMPNNRCDGSGGNNGGGGDPPTGNELLNESFDGISQYEVIDLADWYNIAEVGSDAERWFGNEFNDNKYAEASAYESADSENIIWLISKAIDLSEATTINFESAQHHWAHDGFSVWVSDDFDGSNIEDASWIEISCNLPGQTNDWYDMVPSGNIDLTDYISTGSVHVGFRYEGTSGGNTTGYQLDNVVIK